MSSWGCPHEYDNKCSRINNLPCDPGMKGCVLFGRFVWTDESKNRPRAAGYGSKPEPVQGEKDTLQAGRPADQQADEN
ncbi:MAG: hypothetical protein OEV15_00795 [Gallionella sp.]|nr:hypothetical protein [Gallionella sp.]